MRLARVLCWPLCRIGLGQAVCGVRANFRIAVEGVLVVAGWVLVEERAANLVFIVAAVVLGGLLAGDGTRSVRGGTHAGVRVPIVVLGRIVGHDGVQLSTGVHWRWR